MLLQSKKSMLQVQVNLKSSGQLCSQFRHGIHVTIGKVSRRSGVASSALRFYEERGLISSVCVAPGIAVILDRFCAGLRLLSLRRGSGLPSRRSALELGKLPADRIPTRGDWARLSGGWTKRIDQRIVELQRIKDGLTQCIGCGCLSIDKCKLANPADRAGRRGPGPRYWLG